MDYAQAIGILADALDSAIMAARENGLTNSEIAGELQVTIDGLEDE
jgi:hypothetical protein